VKSLLAGSESDSDIPRFSKNLLLLVKKLHTGTVRTFRRPRWAATCAPSTTSQHNNNNNNNHQSQHKEAHPPTCWSGRNTNKQAGHLARSLGLGTRPRPAKQQRRLQQRQNEVLLQIRSQRHVQCLCTATDNFRPE
jgi:hypothetical protein